MTASRRLIGAIAVIVLLTCLLLEGALPFLDARFAVYFRRPAVQPALSDAAAFLNEDRFDAKLGWLSKPPIHDLDTSGAPLAQAYGDSFVRSGYDSGMTWEAAFEQITGKAILNYGENAYGLDQAVLKFERYRDAHPTRIAILGLYSEELRRARGYYIYNYFINYEAWRYAFKPFFVPEGGSFRLVPPPCADAKCLVDAVAGGNPEVNKVLEQNDYWYRLDRARPVLGFPRTWSFAQAASRIIVEGRSLGRDESVFVDAVAIELTEYLVKRFAEGARAAGLAPVCLIIYSARELAQVRNGSRQYERLQSFLDHEGIASVDTGAYILQSLPAETKFGRLSVPDGHMNREGERLIAEALAQGLRRLGLL